MYHPLMCDYLKQITIITSSDKLLGGKYLYQKRKNLAVKNLIKLILTHFIANCVIVIARKVLHRTFRVFSCSVKKLSDFFCDMNLLYYTILYYTILYYTILYYTILYYTILYYTILYYTILYYTILYYTILYYTILYYTILL